MVAVPAATPVTTPVEEPTVAFGIALLVQVPPDAVSVRAIVAPIHAVEDPEMAEGIAYTVTVFAVIHPANV